MSQAVNERTTAYLQIVFRDKAGALATPTAVTYRIDCLTSGQAVRASTAVSPASEVEIVLTADDNAIRQADSRAEARRVTVVASYGSTADQATARFDYAVTNLDFVT